MSDQGSIAGEDSLIQSYFAPLAAGFAGAFGLEDDCAALTPEPGHDIVLKTDAIAEGVHFFPQDQPEDIAWKALAVNVSDFDSIATTLACDTDGSEAIPMVSSYGRCR